MHGGYRLGHGPQLHRLRAPGHRRHQPHVRRRSQLSQAGPVLGDRGKVRSQHLLYGADRPPGDDARRRQMAPGPRPFHPPGPGNRGRAHQPRGLDVVLQGHRQGKMPHRGHLVADRDRRYFDHSPAGRLAHQTRVRHQALPRRGSGRNPGRRLAGPAERRADIWSSANPGRE